MARRRRRRNKKSSNGVLTIVMIGLALGIVGKFIQSFSDSGALRSVAAGGSAIALKISIVIIAVVLAVFIIKARTDKQRKELLSEILHALNLENIDSQLKEYDDHITVKSHQTLDNYSDLKYFKDNDCFESVRAVVETKKQTWMSLEQFLNKNDFQNRPQYGYVRDQLTKYALLADGYRILVTYITPAGNKKAERTIYISQARIDDFVAHPEYLMTKGEYNQILKQQSKEELEAKKHALYDQVNSIIDFANNAKEKLIVKSQEKALDELVQKLFDRTVNSIQKVSKIDSDEWSVLQNFISSIDSQIQKIVQEDKRISDYYESEDFSKIKETCSLLTQSQKDFNEYINEKAQSITKLFGVRIVRNETANEDTFNYIRAYKKSITPFTAEVSATVFGSAENNPIAYIVKYFYPNKVQYPEQIEKLRALIGELETLKEAKVIIDNYKKDYDQYISNVPQYVTDNDEAGFYSRLGLTIIDESVLNVEYKFTYTSNGGMAQRSFTVPMNEENITALVYQLESKLTQEALTKEQRALMTTKLRIKIKERDNYTCRQCGNSVAAEPNLLLEIDHIIPVAKGGLTTEDNLQTLCWKCNRSKGAKLI